MSIEKALKLKNAVLQLASRTPGGVEFNTSAPKKDTPDALLTRFLNPGDTAVLVSSRPASPFAFDFRFWRNELPLLRSDPRRPGPCRERARRRRGGADVRGARLCARGRAALDCRHKHCGRASKCGRRGRTG